MSEHDDWAEINRLEAENARLRAELAAYVAQAERGNQTMVAEACELRKEITRLRAELATERERADARRKTVLMLCRENAEMEADRDKAEAERDALRALLQKARDALNSVLIGGNHLALLIGVDHPLHTATHEEARKHYLLSRDTYEIWCCWRTMMHAGPTLARIDAALNEGGGDE